MACRELFHISFWYLKSTIIVFLLLSPCLSSAASDGDPLWPTPGDEEGILLETTTSPKTLGNYRVISDANGGAIVVWTYVTSLTPSAYSAQLKASRIDHTGKKLWMGLVSYKAMSRAPAVIPDGAGGVIVAWAEGRGDASGYKIYAQRLNATGNQLWGTTGVPLSNSFSAHSSFPMEAAPVICPDNIGEAYVGWGSRLSRISPDGKVSPPGLDGIELIPGGKGPFQLISDGTGGPSLEVKPPPLNLAPSGIGLESVSSIR